MLSRKFSHIKFAFIAFIVEVPLLISFIWMMGSQSQPHFNVRQIAEWLINYEGGFVRRGLVGEILLKTTSSPHIFGTIYSLVFYSFFTYIILFILIYLKAKIKKWDVLAAAIVLQGGIFHMGTGNIFYTRKEGIFLVFFATLALLYLQIQSCPDKHRNRWLTVFVASLLLITPLMILMHEAYFFMGFPAAFLLLWVLCKENLDVTFLRKVPLIYAVEAIGVFVVCSIHHGDILVSQKIWESLSFANRLFLSPTAPYTPLGPIDSIGWSLSQHLATIYAIFSTGGVFIWLFFIVGNFLSLAYIIASVSHSKDHLGAGQFLRLILIGIATSSTMFFIASDWGRWLGFMSNQSVILIFIFAQSRLALSPEKNQVILAIGKVVMRVGSGYMLVLGLIYGLLFQMPECCVDYQHIFFPYKKYLVLLFSPN